MNSSASTTQSAAQGGRFIGMDEAGYGPNLGPLVITTSVCKTPGKPAACRFYELLQNIVDVQSPQRGGKLHIADSKLVNVGKYGFVSLEASALALLNAAGVKAQTANELRDVLACPIDDVENRFGKIPWFQEDVALPITADASSLQPLIEHLQTELDNAKLKCETIRAMIVPAVTFNQLLSQHGTKGRLLSQLALSLLGNVWKAEEGINTLFVGDKHGGRNRYDEFLAPLIGDAMIMRIEESRAISRYRVNSTELRFQTKGEEHFPVAAASIVAKYVREVSMLQFNNFWQSHKPKLKPTKGYPMDAKRFRSQIRELQAELNISDGMLWRER